MGFHTCSTTLSLLTKLASIAIHVEEYLSTNGHHFDRAALDSLLADSEVVEELARLKRLGMIPEKRAIHPADLDRLRTVDKVTREGGFPDEED